MPFKSDDKLVEGFQKSDMIESSFYEITLVALQERDCIGARVEAEISLQANKIQEKNDDLARVVAVRLKEK